MILRRGTREVRAGAIAIGGGAPVSVQSMLKTDPHDVRASVEQIARLAARGCEIARMAVPDRKAAKALGEIRRESELPLVADVHFDPRLALASLEAGADKVRVNPGNTSDEEGLRLVARESAARGVSVRIGANSGSVRARSLDRGRPMPEALASVALDAAKRFEDWGQPALVLSVKASSVVETVRAYRLAAEGNDYPLHLGLTAAGPADLASAKSFAAMGALLVDGLGDTVRFSYTGAPEAEVDGAWALLEALGLRRRSTEVLSCPTCGRCRLDLAACVAEVRARLADYPATDLTVAVMGCVVNGPGEAAEADVGLAGAPEGAVLFAKGERVRRVGESEMVDTLLAEFERLLSERSTP